MSENKKFETLKEWQLPVEKPFVKVLGWNRTDGLREVARFPVTPGAAYRLGIKEGNLYLEEISPSEVQLPPEYLGVSQEEEETPWYPVSPATHLPILGCECDSCSHFWAVEDQDPHPPMRDCGCVLQCKPYFEVNDQYVPQHAYYRSTAEVDAEIMAALEKMGAIDKLTIKKAVEDFIHALKENRTPHPLLTVSATLGETPSELCVTIESRDPDVITAWRKAGLDVKEP